MFAFVLSAATCTLLFTPLSAVYTIDSTTITGTDITCDQADDCVVNCSDCDQKTITCESGYACTVNCESCDTVTITADQVTNFELNCNNNCYNAQVAVSLSQLDSQFTLNCAAPATPAGSGRNGCRDLDATVDHVASVYSSTSTPSDPPVVISCDGEDACQGIYVDSTVRGNFQATCEGYHACGWGNFVYNPPRGSAGQMNVECLGANSEACYTLNLVSVSARQINLVCGDATSSSDDSQAPCFHLDILGPVYAFDLTETVFSWETLHNDSVTVQCNGYECQSMGINVPFAEHQVQLNDYTYDWDRSSDVRFTCGYDFANTGWNNPERRFDCDCIESLESVVMQPLIDGANLIVTNKYEFSLATQDVLTCPVNGNCIIYSMERYNAGRDTYSGGDYDSEFQQYLSSGSATHINCPTDGVSYCYVFAVQPCGLSLSQIDGSRAQRLLVRGLDVDLQAESAFSFATIQAPDRDHVSGGAILFFEAGNAVGSFRGATIHAENTWMSVVPQIFDALIGATWYHGDSEWLNIDCDYHSMCQDLTLHANHDAFDINGADSDIIPSSLCVACSDSYDASCAGMRLFVTDTSATPPVVYQFNANQDSSTGYHYWVNVDDSTQQIRIASTSDENTCSETTSTNLDESWYGWGGYSDPACSDDGGSGGGDDGVNIDCNWVHGLNVAPALDDFCYAWTFDDQVSWQQRCVDGEPTLTVYEGDSACSSSNSSAMETYGVCNATEVCGYATLSGYTYDETVFECTEAVAQSLGFRQQALFVDLCLGDIIWKCETEAGTDVLIRYDFDWEQSRNCSDSALANITRFETGNCQDNFYAESISCHGGDFTSTEEGTGSTEDGTGSADVATRLGAPFIWLVGLVAVILFTIL